MLVCVANQVKGNKMFRQFYFKCRQCGMTRRFANLADIFSPSFHREKIFYNNKARRNHTLNPSVIRKFGVEPAAFDKVDELLVVAVLFDLLAFFEDFLDFLSLSFLDKLGDGEGGIVNNAVVKVSPACWSSKTIC